MTSEPDMIPKRQPPGDHPERIGKYVVEEYLGGGMCHVYRAKDSVIGKTVAVKILKPENNSDPESRDRFLREAQLAANMDHPNIISVYSFVPDERQPYMVMEFLKGNDLGTLIKEKRTAGVDYKLRIALQVAKALQYIHEQQIIFRDVKPDNIHINEAGVVKIMDFGIAKREDLNITRPGFTMGTAYYMAPEQIRGQEVTPLSDIYAYGILLFELFAGFRPISGDNYEQVFYRLLEEPIDLQPLQQANVPQSVIALVQACTAKDPAQRPQGFLQICPILEREIAAINVPKTQTSPVETPKSYRMIWAAAVMVAVVSIILGIWFFRSPELSGDKVNTPTKPKPAAPVLPTFISTPTGEMALIPAGTFLSGADKTTEELPDFYIDRTEVTNEAYGKFCAAMGKTPPAGFADAPPDFPVVNITIDDARQFARWAGKELPTVKKWEKAARGKDGRAFPWGNDADPAKANVGHDSLVAVNSFAAGDSPWGVHQMVGNAWEFVDELRTPSALAIRTFKDLKPPATKDESWYLMMGGSYVQDLSKLSGVTYDTAFVPARFRSETVGFRCVRNP